MASLFKECVHTASIRSFYNHYQKHFSIVEAHTDDLKEQAYKLRYEVFCEENGHKLFTDTPEGLEMDAYDERARHFLLIYIPTGEVAGTVRVVIPGQEKSLFSIPLQELCDHPMLFNPRLIGGVCEISRLCMSKKFRSREGDGSVLPGYTQRQEGYAAVEEGFAYLRRSIPYAPVGLIRAALWAVLANKSLNCVMAVDPADFESLKILGMDYRVLGPKLKYYGDMLPIVFNAKYFMDNMKVANPACWEVVSDRGDLSEQANRIASTVWYDTIFDDRTREQILQQIL